jgi:hypothetical protein
LNLIPLDGIAPHPIPLPGGERDRVRGPLVKNLNAFALVFRYVIKEFTKVIDTDMGLCG